ncbi:MAG: tRNA epoxyqueuosine(34) reductase QueG [Phycisphaeraceae bacterium]|nr:tRNA epoxyqueuosine(34) reductase QueG [Phycisphaeraceae bacterium]
MPATPEQLAGEVLDRCRRLGFSLAGIAPAAPASRPDEMLAWLAAGRHGEMDWLTEFLPERLDIRALIPGARSVVMVGDLYAARDGAAPVAPEGRGRVARYAHGRDYHRVIKRRLHILADDLRGRFPEHTFRSFVDTAPVMEREHALRAGLGWIGKHTLLIHPRLGSYLLLGGLATTLELAVPPDQEAIPDRCGACTRCIDACPTGAIAPYAVDASRCISYLTIEHEAPIDRLLHAAMGSWVAGCDVCQEVCPHNSARPAGGHAGSPGPNPEYSAAATGFDLVELLEWTESRRRAAFASSALKRISLPMMRRNAAIAAGNALRTRDDPALRSQLERAASDPGEAEMVRSAAAAALKTG